MIRQFLAKFSGGAHMIVIWIVLFCILAYCFYCISFMYTVLQLSQ
jgi:hypothetical protein